MEINPGVFFLLVITIGLVSLGIIVRIATFAVAYKYSKDLNNIMQRFLREATMYHGGPSRSQIFVANKWVCTIKHWELPNVVGYRPSIVTALKVRVKLNKLHKQHEEELKAKLLNERIVGLI